MTGELAQFAASLGAVAALVVMVHLLGFSSGATLGSEAEARDLFRLAPGGFEPVVVALDREGRGAIGRDRQGRIAVLVPHGRQFVARVLLPTARLGASNDALTIECTSIARQAITLRLGDSAGVWAGDAVSAS